MSGVVHELEPTMKLAFKAWWAFAWRSMLAAIVAGAALGALFGLVFAMLKLNIGTSPIPGLMGMALGAYLSVWIFQRLMIKGFGNYKIVIVEK
jgi:ABC-type uncharacterized transport system permease subunit